MRLIARYLTAALLAVALVALNLGAGSRPAAAAPATAITGLTLGSQAGTLIAGSGGSVTYSVTLTRNSSPPNNNTANVGWTVTGLPAGATASFALIANWSGGNTRTYQMTVETTAATPAGATPFTVRAYRTANPSNFATAAATLTVDVPPPPPPPAETTTCDLTGNTRTCDLTAEAGSITLPTATGTRQVPVWSYTLDGSELGAVGPTLIANAGEELVINLTNTLAEPTSLQIAGLAGRADRVGAAANGGTASYSFSDIPAGTYLYQAGILTGSGPRQIAMGLVGALVVREAGGSAYGHAFDEEAVLVYSEIDPGFNANPAGFVLQRFNPTYLLINGKVYPDTAPIAATAGSTLLLRHVNAGIRFHSFGVLGLRQTIIADDGGVLPVASSLFARTIGAGQTMDSLLRIPAGAPAGTKYALFETGMPGHGPAGANGMGGMLTFIGVQPAGADIVGPLVTAELTPASSDGTVDVTLDVTADDTTTGGSPIAAASYTIDGGAPVALSVTGSNVSASLSATIPAASVASLSVGAHTVAVSASDAAGNTTSTSVTLTRTPVVPPPDTTAPVVSDLSMVSPSSSTTTVALSATATDNVEVAGATYTIGGSTLPFSFTPGPAVALSADVNVSTLADGIYSVAVSASDSAGNPSDLASASLTLDRGAPTVSGTLSPDPVAPGAGLALSASLSDALTRIVSASYAIDGGAAVSLSAQDGVFDSTGESVQAVLSTGGLALGDHTLVLSASDAAGNLGTLDIPFGVSDSLFADGFETGDTSGWSSQSTTSSRLTVNSAAAMDGTGFGLQAGFGSSGSTNQNYVQRSQTVAENQLHVRFYLNPHGQNFGSGAKTIFRALNGTSEAFRVQIRRVNASTYQVRAQVRRAGGTSSTAWQAINANSANYLEVAWAQGAGTQFQLYVNNAAPATLSNLLTSAYAVNTLRLGPQSSGANGTNIYLDEFVVTRSTLIGQ